MPGDDCFGAAYNNSVAPLRSQHDPSRKPQRHPIFATETFGLLLIAFLILVVLVVRYWHLIHWSQR
jgi:hypothetical protein